MKAWLVLAVGLGLAVGVAITVAAGAAVAAAPAPCDRYVLGYQGVDLGDCGDPAHPCLTVQYAVARATDGDTVCVADHRLTPGPTVYTGTVVLTRSLILDGAWEAECSGSGEPACTFAAVPCAPGLVVLHAAGAGRVIDVAAGVAPTIDCFVLTGGDASGLGGDPQPPVDHDAGGGIYSGAGAAPVIVNNVITGNVACSTCATGAGRGGAIYLLDAPATAVISANLIAGNAAGAGGQGQGGGIMLRGSDARVLYNRVELNRAGQSAGDGGGIAVQGGAPEIAYNQILTNTAGSAARARGGGLFAWQGALPAIHDNQIAANVAMDGYSTTGRTSRGGGIYCEASPGLTVTIERNELRLNTAAPSDRGQGGGLFVSNTVASLVGNRFVENRATPSAPFPGDGGGVALYLATGSVIHANAFERNIGPDYGGAVYLRASAGVKLSGNRLDTNRAHDGGGLYALHSDGLLIEANWILGNKGQHGGGVYLYDSAARLDNNVVADNDTSTYSGASGIQVMGDTALLRHNTLARNGIGSGLNVSSYAGGRGVAVLTNTVVVSHTIAIQVAKESTATLEATLWGSGPWANGTDWTGLGTIVTGTVNYWGDPAFLAHPAGDYHLTAASDALDRGVPTGVTADVDHQRRSATSPDLGADELWRSLYLPLVVRR